MIENTSEADILHLKHVWAKYWSPQNFQFCNFLKLASNVFNTHGQYIIFPKPILWYLETSISMSALLLIWFIWKVYFRRNYEYGCACFSCLSKWLTRNIVKRASSSWLKNLKFFNGKFCKLAECLYHLHESHLNWFACTREPYLFIFTSWEWIFGSKHRLLADVIKWGYHGNNTAANPNVVVYAHPPR